MLRNLISGLCAVLCPFTCFAAVISSAPAGGNWNSTGSWIGGRVPGSADDVIITAGSVIRLNVANVTAGIRSLKVEANARLLMSGSNGINFNIQGDIENNGAIDLWAAQGQGATLYLRGNSTWSGDGRWNLSQVNVSTFALEFANDMEILVNRKIDINQVSGSINKTNRRPGVHFVMSSGDTPSSLPCHTDNIFYGRLTIDKKDRVSFIFTSNAGEDNEAKINLLGALTVNPGTQLNIGNFHVLEVSELHGNGRVRGGASSDILISGNGPQIRLNTGTAVFRNFTVDRPSGVALDSTMTVRNTLSLNNGSHLVLPSGNNFSLVIGSGETAGAFAGNGFLEQPPWTLVRELADLTILGTAPEVKLRFFSAENPVTLHDMTITKQEGIVSLEPGTDLWIRNTFLLNRGIFALGNSSVRLTGPLQTSPDGQFRGSFQAGLSVGNTVSAAAATLYFDQSGDPENRTVMNYTQFRNAQITLGNALCVAGSLDLSTGSQANILVSNGNLTLGSSAERTAAVLPLNASSITGDVHVQRFISGMNERGYRLISSPVYQQQDTYTIASLLENTFITGPAGGGFDASTTNNPSVWVYRERDPGPGNQRILDSDYKGLLRADVPVPVGSGLLFFNRGSRVQPPGFNKLSGPFPKPDNNTLMFTGRLNRGTITARIPAQHIANFSTESEYAKEGPGSAQPSAYYYNGSLPPESRLTFTNWFAESGKPADERNDGLHLLGNPYASPINLHNVDFGTDMSSRIYVYNPLNRQFSAYHLGTGLDDGNGASAYISSGEGFFVQARPGNNATVTFSEQSKVPANQAGPLRLMGKSGVKKAQKIVIRLERDSIAYDSAAIGFDEAAESGLDELDAPDNDGFNATVSLSSFSADGKRLSINMLPFAAEEQIVPLYTRITSAGDYIIRITDKQLNGKTVMLNDHFAQTLTALDKGSVYTFTHQPDRNSEKRFSLHISPAADEAVFTSENPVRIAKTKNWFVYPNPAQDRLGIRIPDGEKGMHSVRIMDMNGKPLRTFAAISGDIDVTSLQPGTYIIELFNRQNRKTAGRNIFIKQ